MIRLPLIGIRFTGLDQHRTGWSQSAAHICTESGSLRTRVCRAAWPTISFSSQNRRPAITHSASGQRSSEHTHVWQLSCVSQTLIRGPPYWHLSWFVSTLTVKKQDSWEVCSVTERTDQRGEKVKEGRADKGIREQGLPAIFSAFVASWHRTHMHGLTQNRNTKNRDEYACTHNC